MAKDKVKDAPASAAPEGNNEALRPFLEASNRFLQAQQAAAESTATEQARAWLDHQDAVRQIEQEAQKAFSAAARKYLDQVAQPTGTGSTPEQLYTARAEAQAAYENEVRRIYTDAQQKVADLQKQSEGGGGGGGKLFQQAVDQRQNAYQTYLSELQQAWANTKSLDPQTINAIASHILLTVNTSGYGGQG